LIRQVLYPSSAEGAIRLSISTPSDLVLLKPGALESRLRVWGAFLNASDRESASSWLRFSEGRLFLTIVWGQDSVESQGKDPDVRIGKERGRQEERKEKGRKKGAKRGARAGFFASPESDHSFSASSSSSSSSSSCSSDEDEEEMSSSGSSSSSASHSCTTHPNPTASSSKHCPLQSYLPSFCSIDRHLLHIIFNLSSSMPLADVTVCVLDGPTQFLYNRPFRPRPGVSTLSRVKMELSGVTSSRTEGRRSGLAEACVRSVLREMSSLEELMAIWDSWALPVHLREIFLSIHDPC
jgi:hypothetical protein